MKTFKQHIDELYKTYPGKGWVYGTKDEPKNIKPNDIVWRSKIHHWDDTVRSDNTRFIITKTGKGKDKFQMWAKSDKSGNIVFHFGDKPTLDDGKIYGKDLLRGYRVGRCQRQEKTTEAIKKKICYFVNRKN